MPTKLTDLTVELSELFDEPYLYITLDTTATFGNRHIYIYKDRMVWHQVYDEYDRNEWYMERDFSQLIQDAYDGVFDLLKILQLIDENVLEIEL